MESIRQTYEDTVEVMTSSYPERDGLNEVDRDDREAIDSNYFVEEEVVMDGVRVSRAGAVLPTP